MWANLGTFDRIARLVVGLALVGYGVYEPSPLRWIGLAGVVLIATAIIRFCPIYWLLRIKTIGRKPQRTGTQ